MYPILVFNKVIISSADATSSPVSVSQFVGECTHYSIQTVWNGSSLVGNIVTQASNDNINWTQVDSSATSGNSGSYLYNSPLIGYTNFRVIFTFTSGTGTITSTACGKLR